MLSVAPASYHSISPAAANPLPPPPPPRHPHNHRRHPPPRPSRGLSLSLSPLLYVNRWVTAVLNVRLSDRGHAGCWRDARGRALTSCPRNISMMAVEWAGFSLRVCAWWEETIDSHQSLSLCNRAAGQVKVTGFSSSTTHNAQVFMCVAEKRPFMG